LPKEAGMNYRVELLLDAEIVKERIDVNIQTKTQKRTTQLPLEANNEK